MSKFEKLYEEIMNEASLRIQNLDVFLGRKYHKTDFKKIDDFGKWKKELPNSTSGIDSTSGELKRHLQLVSDVSIAYRKIDSKNYLIVGIYYHDSNYGIIIPDFNKKYDIN